MTPYDRETERLDGQMAAVVAFMFCMSATLGLFALVLWLA